MTETQTVHQWMRAPAGQGSEPICRLCGVRRSQQATPCQPDVPHERKPETEYDPFE